MLHLSFSFSSAIKGKLSIEVYHNFVLFYSFWMLDSRLNDLAIAMPPLFIPRVIILDDWTNRSDREKKNRQGAKGGT